MYPTMQVIIQYIFSSKKLKFSDKKLRTMETLKVTHEPTESTTINKAKLKVPAILLMNLTINYIFISTTICEN